VRAGGGPRGRCRGGGGGGGAGGGGGGGPPPPRRGARCRGGRVAATSDRVPAAARPRAGKRPRLRAVVGGHDLHLPVADEAAVLAGAVPAPRGRAVADQGRVLGRPCRRGRA